MSTANRFRALFVPIVLFSTWGAGSTPAYGADAHASRLLVRFRPNTTGTLARSVLRVAGDATITRTYGHVSGLYLVEVDPAQLDSARQSLNTDESVLYAEPDYELHAFERPSDPRFPERWGLENNGQTGGTPGADIRAIGAWATWTGDPSFRVAVTDTGVDYNHPDLAANIWTNAQEIPSNGIDDDGNGYVDDIHGFDTRSNDGDPMDDGGHGTHVAGTIGCDGSRCPARGEEQVSEQSYGLAVLDALQTLDFARSSLSASFPLACFSTGIVPCTLLDSCSETSPRLARLSWIAGIARHRRIRICPEVLRR